MTNGHRLELNLDPDIFLFICDAPVRLLIHKLVS